MCSLTDSSDIFRYHRDLIAKHGNHGSAALGWRDQLSQTVRFEVLAGAGNMNGHSVLDAGCGHGDLRSYLGELYPEMSYIGVDHIPELIDEAARRYANWPNTTFIQGNFTTIKLPVADYVMVCGSLNYQSADPGFIFKSISRLYSSCRIAFAFNLLSHIEPNGLLVAYNPEQILSYCRSLCKKVVFKDDYDKDDFTVFMYR